MIPIRNRKLSQKNIIFLLRSESNLEGKMLWAEWRDYQKNLYLIDSMFGG